MPVRTILALGAATLLLISACGGGTATSVAPATAAPASEAPASEAPASEAPASDSPSEAPASEAASPSSAGGGACATSTEAGTVSAGMSGFAFDPATIQAAVGDVITWTNGDAAPHTATFRDDPACTTPNLGSGDTGSLTFGAAGSYAIFCKIHPDMSATVEVSG